MASRTPTALQGQARLSREASCCAHCVVSPAATPIRSTSASKPAETTLRLQTRRDNPFRVSVYGAPIDHSVQAFGRPGDPASKVFDDFETVRLPRRRQVKALPMSCRESIEWNR